MAVQIIVTAALLTGAISWVTEADFADTTTVFLNAERQLAVRLGAGRLHRGWTRGYG
jgi:hypothetical protein